MRIHGDKGALEVTHTPDYSSLRACIGEDVEKAIWKTIDVDPVATNYEKFAKAVMEGGPADPDFPSCRQSAKGARSVDHRGSGEARAGRFGLM